MTQQVLPPLSPDEFTVLEMAAMGGFMAPIGRWEKATLHLAEIGLLTKLDDFNYVLSDEGRRVSKQNDRDWDDDIAAMINAAGRVRDDAG